MAQTSRDRLHASIPPAVWGPRDQTSWARVAAECMGLELQGAWDALTWLVAQAYPATADENGLAYWEQLLGLPQAPPNLDTEGRRQVVLARRHIAGPVQIPSIVALIEQYQGDPVTVTWDAPAAALHVEWPSIFGRPANFADVQVALDRYLPAWIGVAYHIRYLTYAELRDSGITYADLVCHGWTYAELLTKSPADLVRCLGGLTWADLADWGGTWADLAAHGWSWAELRIHEPGDL